MKSLFVVVLTVFFHANASYAGMPALDEVKGSCDIVTDTVQVSEQSDFIENEEDGYLIVLKPMLKLGAQHLRLGKTALSTASLKGFCSLLGREYDSYSKPNLPVVTNLPVLDEKENLVGIVLSQQVGSVKCK